MLLIAYVYVYIYICVYNYVNMYIQGLRPLPPAPFWQQATVDWLTAGNCHFFVVKLLFWRPWGSILGTRDTILVILGSEGSPNRHLEVQVCIFSDFKVILGVSWDPLWVPFCEFSVILSARMEDWCHVHVFSGSGMKMVLECNGCMYYNHCKNCGFWVVSLFPLIQ